MIRCNKVSLGRIKFVLGTDGGRLHTPQGSAPAKRHGVSPRARWREPTHLQRRTRPLLHWVRLTISSKHVVRATIGTATAQFGQLWTLDRWVNFTGKQTFAIGLSTRYKRSAHQHTTSSLSGTRFSYAVHWAPSQRQKRHRTNGTAVAIPCPEGATPFCAARCVTTHPTLMRVAHSCRRGQIRSRIPFP